MDQSVFLQGNRIVPRESPVKEDDTVSKHVDVNVELRKVAVSDTEFLS